MKKFKMGMRKLLVMVLMVSMMAGYLPEYHLKQVQAAPDSDECTKENLEAKGYKEITAMDGNGNPFTVFVKLGLQVKDGDSFVDLKAGDKIADGDELQIPLDWAILNTTLLTDATAFTISLKDLMNLLVEGREEEILKDQGGTITAGSYSIAENDSVTINLNKEFVEKSDRAGNVVLSGKVQVAEDSLGNKPGNNDDFQLTIMGQPITVKYDDSKNNGSLSVAKNSSAVTYDAASQKMLLTFKVDFIAKEDAALDLKPITITDIVDTPGGALGEFVGGKVVSSTAASIPVSGADAATMQELFDQVENKSLNEGEKVTMEYTMAIKTDAYAPTANVGPDNKIQATYNTNNENDLTTNKAENWARIDKPTVDKSGSFDANSGKITWTITIALNDYKDLGKAGITQIVDTIDSNQSIDAAVLAKIQDISNYTDKGNGEYTITYETTATDEVLNDTNKTTIVNKTDVTVKLDDSHTYTYGDTGKITTSGKNWIHKELVKYVPDITAATYGNLEWKVTLDIPSDTDTLGRVSVTDDPGYNLSMIYDQIAVEAEGMSKSVLSVATVEDNEVQDSQEVLVMRSKWESGKILFSKGFLEKYAGKPVTLHFATTLTQEPYTGTVFSNKD